MTTPLLMYIVGVMIGAAIPITIWTLRRDKGREATEAIVRDNIRQRAYLEASWQINDDETNERIKQRGEELLEEYDLDVIDVRPEVDER